MQATSQSLYKILSRQLLFGSSSHARRALPLVASRSQQFFFYNIPQRNFAAELEVKKPE
jgi:hypothetical protein